MSTTVPAPVVGKFNVQSAEADLADVAKSPVHWPYIGFSFANNRAKEDEDNILYSNMHNFIDFCGENLEETFLDFYLEENAPGVNSIFEQFTRWYFANINTMSFRWKKTDQNNAWVIYHVGLTQALQGALEFSANGDYILSEKSLELSLKLIDQFKQEMFKSMPVAVYDMLFENNYFGITMCRHF